MNVIRAFLVLLVTVLCVTVGADNLSSRKSAIVAECKAESLRLFQNPPPPPADISTNPFASGHYFGQSMRYQAKSRDYERACIEQKLRALDASEYKKRQDRESNSKRKAENHAIKRYIAFINKYPDARIHEREIASIITDDPSLSLDAAYFKLKAHYAEHGLDWSKPVE